MATIDSSLQTQVYNSIRELLKTYSPPFEVTEAKNVSNKDSYTLSLKGDFVIAGRKRDELWFGAIIKQKAYVGFYFMPVYNDPEGMKKVFSPRLLKTLKGKSCFYIKTNDPELMGDIKHALAEGFKFYKKNGWL